MVSGIVGDMFIDDLELMILVVKKKRTKEKGRRKEYMVVGAEG